MDCSLGWSVGWLLLVALAGWVFGNLALLAGRIVRDRWRTARKDWLRQLPVNRLPRFMCQVA